MMNFPSRQSRVSLGFRLEDVDSQLHVDLGCGGLPRNPFGQATVIGLDVWDSGTRTVPWGDFEFLRIDGSGRIPLEDESVSSLSAFDVIEHIPRVAYHDGVEGGIRFPFVDLMSEVSRILKPGGLFLALTPSYPHQGAFTDPTHVNFITAETHTYFLGDNPPATNAGYGFRGSFEEVLVKWVGTEHPVWRDRRSIAENEPWSDPFGVEPRWPIHLRSVRGTIKFLLGRDQKTHVMWLLRKPK